MVIPAIAISSYAATRYTETVDGITWTYTIENECASVGGGSYSVTAVPKSTSGNITIPSSLGGKPVTNIGPTAFYACSGLTNVTIHDGVTNIGDYAFTGCSSLTSVTIPNSVTNIGNYAFASSGITSVTMGNGVSAWSGKAL